MEKNDMLEKIITAAKTGCPLPCQTLQEIKNYKWDNLEQEVVDYLNKRPEDHHLAWEQIFWLIGQILDGKFYLDHLILNAYCTCSLNKELVAFSGRRMVNTNSSWTVLEILVLSRKDGKIALKRILRGSNDSPYNSELEGLKFSYDGKKLWYYYRNAFDDGIFCLEDFETEDQELPAL